MKQLFTPPLLRLCCLVLLLLGYAGMAKGQAQDSARIAEFTKEIAKLKTSYELLGNILSRKNEQYDIAATAARISLNSEDLDKLKPLLQAIRDEQEKLDSIQNRKDSLMVGYIVIYNLYKNTVDSITKDFPERVVWEKTAQKPAVVTPDEGQIFIYFGDQQIASVQEKQKFMGNAKNMLNHVLSQESKLYLGTLSVAGKGEPVTVYSDSSNPNRTFYLQQVELTLDRGYLQDIIVYLSDASGTVYLFENKVPIALRRYVDIAKINKLFARIKTPHKGTAADNSSLEKGLHIIVADVLQYNPKPGRYYASDILDISFPTEDTKDAHEQGRIAYEVYQNTALRHSVELRTYTDLLGLLNREDNGLATFEGRVNLHFTSLKCPNHYFLFFNSISPFLNYSRLDTDNQYVQTNPVPMESYRPLEIIQKAYMSTGADFDVVYWKPRKTSTFGAGLDIPLRYQLTKVSGQEDIANYGFGFRPYLDVYQNDKLKFTLFHEWMINRLTREQFGDLDFSEQQNISYRRWGGELSYILGKRSSDGGLFGRFYGFNHKDSKDHFFQLQVGYRFSIGF